MANGEHLALLQQGVADLQYTDLTGAELSGAKLAEAKLSWANLSGADLSGADLAEANLRWTNLSEANLSGANLSTANLSGANLSGANLSGANLSGANLRGVILEKADLRGANLSGAVLVDAKLSFTNLEKANLSEADLNVAGLSEANLNGANLEKANLREAKLDGAFLIKANLSRAGLCRTGLCSADLSGADLSGADLSGADLSKANLSAANLRGAYLCSTKFCKANLSAASLEKTQVLGTKFNNATLTGICIEDWNTNSATKLDNVICDYVYLRQFQQERRPLLGHFAPNEFSDLFQKALETVDLSFDDSIDWQAFAYSFNKVQVENESAQLDVRSIENKQNGVIVAKVSVCPGADKNKIHRDFMQTYEFACKVLEEQYQAERRAAESMVAIQKAQSVRYEGQINRLLDTIAQQGLVQKAIAAQQNVAEVAAKLQQLLEQLSRNYPTATNLEKLTVVAKATDEIKSNPTLKSQVISAIKTRGDEVFKKSIDHPLINILVATIEEA